MNRKRATVWQSGPSLVVVLPKTWVDGMDIARGDRVELVFNGEIHIRKLEDPDG